MANPIIILGSSRSHGNTRKAINQIIGKCDIPLVDLNTLSIKPYDYEYLNKSDDFIPLIERIVEFDTIILATPVYWYTMSALMKIFIDRITDLLDIRKDLGRKLRGKKLFVIASFGTSLPKGFEDTFEQTCQYLGVEYLGTSFVYVGENDEQFMENNQQAIEKAKLILPIVEKSSTQRYAPSC
ncbi:MAG: NAD(P)H-dependent oxidoreductase [Proteobacteria bacterium]|nr:NAD(P)H-dependent oxidoreductase [Pseudomonadota bacterium]